MSLPDFRRPEVRKKFLAGSAALALITLIALGAMAKNGWLLSEPPALAGGMAHTNTTKVQSHPESELTEPALPPPTPQLSKEYIYAGSRLLAVEDKNANAAPPADLAIWRASTGIWWVFNPATGGIWTSPYQWGSPNDIPVPGDFDGDGKTDTSVFRPSNFTWYLAYSSTGGSDTGTFGATTDVPAPADYDGDGKTDRAVYRPPVEGQPNGYWHLSRSSAGYHVQGWGEAGDIPASADYDGDGKADIGVWRPSSREFLSINSSNNGIETINSGIASGTYSWKTVSADYDGDGKADYAVYDALTANWHIGSSQAGTFTTTQWGSSGDIPVHNDYDADSKVDLTTWRPSGPLVGNWFIRQSATANSLRQITWGQSGDVPVPAFYRR